MLAENTCLVELAKEYFDVCRASGYSQHTIDVKN